MGSGIIKNVFYLKSAVSLDWPLTRFVSRIELSGPHQSSHLDLSKTKKIRKSLNLNNPLDIMTDASSEGEEEMPIICMSSISFGIQARLSFHPR